MRLKQACLCVCVFVCARACSESQQAAWDKQCASFCIEHRSPIRLHGNQYKMSTHNMKPENERGPELVFYKLSRHHSFSLCLIVNSISCLCLVSFDC